LASVSPDVVRILHITRGDGRLTAKSDTPKRAKKGQKQPEKGQKQGKTGVFKGVSFFSLPPPQKTHLAAVSFPYIVVFLQEKGF
jgi:hypothetical protein